MNSMDQKAQFVFDQAKAQGATADLIIDEGQSLSLKARDGKIEEHKVSSAQIFGVRTIKEGKMGLAYSEAADEESLTYMLNESLNNGTFSEVDTTELILDSQEQLKTEDELLYPKDETHIDTKIQFALDLEQSLLDKEHIQSLPYNGVASGEGQRSYYTTAGLKAFSRSKYANAYAYALAAREGQSTMNGASRSFRTFNELSVEEIVQEVNQRCDDMLSGTPIASGKYDVIFDKNMLPALFGIFSLVFSAKSAKEGLNPWREKLGQQVMDSRLKIVDRPHLKEGFGYELFDSEGVKTQDLVLAAEGKLQSFIHNSATAAHFKTQTTGHASRGPKSTLGVGLHQLTIAEGTASESELLAGEYLEVTSLDGLHSGANAISGDFSFGASGYLKKEGKTTQVVRGVTVAGNFYEMLNKIRAIGDKAYWDDGKSVRMALIRFADLAISG